MGRGEGEEGGSGGDAGGEERGVGGAGEEVGWVEGDCWWGG